jgi:hypothetical protein
MPNNSKYTRIETETLDAMWWALKDFVAMAKNECVVLGPRNSNQTTMAQWKATIRQAEEAIYLADLEDDVRSKRGWRKS